MFKRSLYEIAVITIFIDFLQLMHVFQVTVKTTQGTKRLSLVDNNLDSDDRYGEDVDDEDNSSDGWITDHGTDEEEFDESKVRLIV